MSRIGTLQKPYPEAFAAAMAKVMPPGVEPLTLFTAVAQSPRAWDRFSGGSMAGKGPLDFRTREIVILRTAARTGCEYEWGTHVTLFAAKAGFSDAQVASTANGHAEDSNWNDPESAVIATVDALLADKRLSDEQFARIAAHFDTPQILEIIQLTGFYHGVALITGALDLQPEAGMARFPAD